jgi:two-component system, NarL family, invasion response regulator UvrY
MSTAETTADGPASDYLGPRVFLVDDDEGLRARVRELLEDEGITVVGEASTGAGALELVPIAAMVGPLVVLMDVRMPGGVNGIEATRLLVGSGANIRIIVFTGFPDRGIEQAASEAGAIAVLVKGGRVVELIAAVRRAWGGVVVGN